MEPLGDSPWSRPTVVQGFVTSPPNDRLIRFVESERTRIHHLRILDIGCGAGRNALPLAQGGLRVVGVDLSWPMLRAAGNPASRGAALLFLALASMDKIPVHDRSFDVVIAHGIWNLARTGVEFRQAVREAARVSRPGAALFLFTFSRNTLPEAARPIAGETFVFTEFSGEPQCFLTGEQLEEELAAAGFAPDPAFPLTEHNRARPGQLKMSGPVIYEGVFRLTRSTDSMKR